MIHKGHYGCPSCGSLKFIASRDAKEYVTNEWLCAYFAGVEEGDDEFDEVEVLNTHFHDSESEAFEDEKTCRECKHQYIEPKFYADRSFNDKLDEKNLPAKTVEVLTTLLAQKAPHAADFDLEEEPHALLVRAQARKQQRGSGQRTWQVCFCPACNSEMDNYTMRSEELRVNPLGLEDDGVLRDNRGLPLMLVVPLCRKCSPSRI
ncbi:MAG: hypothetical protein IT462_11575 [Planctomycetes bacterium]|nr:hypothetical protein [Planctomycetota bacterium]